MNPRPTRATVGREFVAPVAIGVGALVLRLAFVTQYAGHPLGRLPWVDEGAYWARAQEIIAGAWLPGRPYFQDPLFPYLLAGLMKVVGSDVSRLRIALACLGACTPVAVYWAGRRGFGRAEGWVAGVLAAACGPWMFTDGQLEKEGAAALFAALALVATAAAAPGARGWRAGVAGAAWGLVALLRANALALAPLGFLWCVATRERRRGAAKGLVYLAGFALALAPVTLVNAWVSHPHQFILTTWQAGANFYIGNGPEATGTYAAPAFVEANPAREADDYAAEAARRAGRSLSETEVSRFWFQQGWMRWVDAPAASLRLLGRKLAFVLNDREIPDNQDFEGVRLLAAPRLSLGVVSFGVLLPLAALGLVRRERSPFWWFLVGSTVLGLATTAVFFVVGRYRVPWLPGLALLAASGVVEIVRLLAARQWARVGGCLILALLATAAAWWPLDDPAPDRWGHQEIALAVAYLNEGQLGAAIDALDDARALGSGPAERVSALLAAGPVHDRVAQLIAARQGLPVSADTNPDVERARWYRQLPDRRAESQRVLADRLRAAPDDATARREWGAWRLGDKDDPASRQHARDELARAAGAGPSVDISTAVLLALLTADPSRLPLDGRATNERQHVRLRLARAALAARRK